MINVPKKLPNVLQVLLVNSVIIVVFPIIHVDQLANAKAHVCLINVQVLNVVLREPYNAQILSQNAAKLILVQDVKFVVYLIIHVVHNSNVII
jgi:hypothetical protein